eukprot:1819164-Rhodomonas_salina.1
MLIPNRSTAQPYLNVWSCPSLVPHNPILVPHNVCHTLSQYRTTYGHTFSQYRAKYAIRRYGTRYRGTACRIPPGHMGIGFHRTARQIAYPIAVRVPYPTSVQHPV